MLTHTVLTRISTNSLASYYEDGADDYYAKDGDASEWQGKGAEELGLEGSVDKETFKKLLEGKVPGGEQSRSSSRKDSKSRVGFDLTFSAPKSVSIQALVYGDPKIIEAHDKAVAFAVSEAETKTQSRKKVSGKTYVENTNNLIVAKYRHETSREKDPQLHTHAVVMNLTKRADGEWRAIKNDDIVKSTKYLGSVYRAELAKQLQKAGYTLRLGKEGSFELAHITRDQLEGFSKRSEEIESRLAQEGLTRDTASTAKKQYVAMSTRAKKTNEDKEAIFDDWKNRAKELGINFDKNSAELLGGNSSTRVNKEFEGVSTSLEAKRAVKFAVHHLTERQSIMKESSLLDISIKHAVGNAGLKDIREEMSKLMKEGFLIKEEAKYTKSSQINSEESRTYQEWINLLVERGSNPKNSKATIAKAIKEGSLKREATLFTTHTAVSREKKILKIENRGRGQVIPIMGANDVRESLAQSSLNKGQKRAVESILTTENRIIGIQGSAGVGKSFLLKKSQELIEGSNSNVRVLAPYGAQVKDLRSDGLAANTVASFLVTKDKKIDSSTVLVVDEAALVPTRQMEKLLSLAEKSNSKVVLLGDVEQTKAIEAGKPFYELSSNGMETSIVDEILRQKNTKLKKAVELASKGNASGSLPLIETVIEDQSLLGRAEKMVDRYMELPPSDQQKTLLVAGTNESRKTINDLIRTEKGLTKDETEFDVLSRKDTTNAERRYSKYYLLGDVIQPEKDYANGLKRGELYKVADTGIGHSNKLRVIGKEDEVIEFNPMIANKISIYSKDRIGLFAGDQIKITRNDKDKDLANGDRYKVTSVTEESVFARNEEGRSIELDAKKPMHIDHAYASTVHSAQGLTSDRVMIDIDTKSMTASKEVYYVGISRAKEESIIFTDDASRLPKAISRETEKHSALDLALLFGSKNNQKKDSELKRQEKSKAQHSNASNQERQRSREG